MGSITKHLDQSYSQNMSNQNRLLATASILLFVVSCYSYKISTRDYCPPKPTTMNPFDPSKFLGDWYQVSGLPAFFQPEGTTCIRATYGEMDYGKLSVRNVAINHLEALMKFVAMPKFQILLILENSKYIFLLHHLETIGLLILIIKTLLQSMLVQMFLELSKLNLPGFWLEILTVYHLKQWPTH